MPATTSRSCSDAADKPYLIYCAIKRTPVRPGCAVSGRPGSHSRPEPVAPVGAFPILLFGHAIARPCLPVATLSAAQPRMRARPGTCAAGGEKTGRHPADAPVAFQPGRRAHSARRLRLLYHRFVLVVHRLADRAAHRVGDEVSQRRRFGLLRGLADVSHHAAVRRHARLGNRHCIAVRPLLTGLQPADLLRQADPRR